MISLRRLAVTDLSVKYARNMGGNKIRHYRVPYTETVLGGKNALDLVKSHILREEGKEGSEVEIAEEATADLLPPATSGVLKTEDVSAILDNDQDIKNSLQKMKTDRMIVQSQLYTFKQKVINFIAKIVNPPLQLLNRGLMKLQRITVEDVIFGKGRFLPIVPVQFGQRFMNLCHYLSVGFEGPDYDKAKQALIADLRILQDNDLIMGHLAMPSLMALADTVGSGKQPYALFCFPVIDYANLYKLNELSPFTDASLLPRDPLATLGLKTETKEGGLSALNGRTIQDQYEIETVDVRETLETFEEVNERVLGSFNESLPVVHKAAEVTRRLLKKYPENFRKSEETLAQAVERNRLEMMKTLTKPKKKRKQVKRKVKRKTKTRRSKAKRK